MLEYPREVYEKVEPKQPPTVSTQQPRPVSALVQASITLCALCVAAAAITFTVWTAREQRNAALVSIGVAVLRADPEKEGQVRAAREWALDLIDANAGGVKFSPEAREQLMERRLGFDLGSYQYANDTPDPGKSASAPKK